MSGISDFSFICGHEDLYDRFVANLGSSNFSPYLPSGSRLAVACSGGADSLALTLLLHRWCNFHDCDLVALIVDHGFRLGSGEEALTVSERLSSFGISSQILSSAGVDFAGGNLQSRLRDFRYSLLSSYCFEHSIGCLFLGHHARDQAETFLLRLRRGSHIKGLGGMSFISRYSTDLHLLRPLLSESVLGLRLFVESCGLGIVEDPSNDFDIFERVRMRKLLPILEEYGLGVDCLSGVSSRLRLASDFISEQSLVYISRLRIHAEGYISCSRDLFREVHPLLHYILLSYIWDCLGVGSYPPRSRSFFNLCSVILGSGELRGRVLGGVMMFGSRSGDVLFCREPYFMDDRFYPLSDLGDNFIWDGRFRVSFCGVGDYRLGPFRADLCGSSLSSADLPHAIKRVLPCIYLDNNLCACPLLGFYDADADTELRHNLDIKVAF